MRSLVTVTGLLLAALVGFGAWWMYRPGHMDGMHGMGSAEGGAMVRVVVPDLSASARIGERLFEENCSLCHGRHAAGSEQGPPLVHRIYEPNHHGDGAFHLAVMRGVQSHHWSFGNMPPVDGVSERDVAKIIEYVRDLQRANGIFQ